MLARVVVENGVKKLVPLTADCGSGNPVGTVIAVYSNKVPNGYLPCNGVAFDTAQFPVLYALLGDDHTPDLRECTLKGIGESGRTVGAHVKAGGLAVGEFVDDRVQDLVVRLRVGTGSQGDALAMTGNTADYENRLSNITTLGARTGATTEVKAVGVNWCIKATSGINENQADNVLSALSPVDTVTSGNMHSVTSNAVANAILTIQLAVLNNTTGNTKFFKITKLMPVRAGNNVYFIQSRGGELIILTCGHGDSTTLRIPKAKRILNDYTKVLGIRYDTTNGDIYIALDNYSHETIVSKICGNWNTSGSTYEEVTQSEWDSKTPITIET